MEEVEKERLNAFSKEKHHFLRLLETVQELDAERDRATAA
jgi:hypothetical protein